MLFDLDGTLVSTGTDLAASVNYMLKQLGLKQKSEEEIIAFVGDGVTKLIERVLGNDYPHYYPAAVKIFSNHYAEHLLDNTDLYPGVEEVLKHFTNKKKVILTNKRYDFTMAIVKGLNLEKYFIEIIGDGSLPYKKPDKRLVEYLLHKYSIDNRKVVIIGDGLNDAYLAKNSGIMCCLYLNGLGRRKELLAADADYYCENILEINSFFVNS